MKYRWLTLLVAIVMAAGHGAYSQAENIWAFGTGSGLDFSNGSPVAISTGMSGFGEANASVCNDQGELLFYTNGSKVWNRNGNLMPNGNGLINDPAMAPLPVSVEDPTSSTSQGALIVPVPGQPSRYYVFSMTCAELGVNSSGVGRLYYSVVDMQQSGGLGDVLPAQKGILLDSGLTEHMTAVVGDHCDIWLLAIGRLQNALRAYNISEAGINASPVVSPLLPVNNYIILGSIAVSSDRRKLAIARSGIGLYDFDPATGTAVGKVPLAGAYTPSTGGYSVCFSPDDSKLYASFAPLIIGLFYSFQYDLSSGDSLTMINSAQPLANPTSYSFKKGPDGKIYTTGGGNALNIIHAPNLPVPACQYEPGALPLQGSVSLGLPHIVPVIRKDTVLTQQQVKAGCFAEGLPLQALNDTSGWDYVWSGGQPGPYYTAGAPGVYWVSYKSPPCRFHTDTFLVSFPEGRLPHLEIRPACSNDTNGLAYAYTYPGDTVQYAYQWRGSAGTLLSQHDTLSHVPSGHYTLRIQTVHCDTTLSFYIPEEDFEVSFTADSLLCLGDSLRLFNTSDNHFTQFRWYLGDQSVSTEASPRHLYGQPGTYTVVLTGSGAVCRDTALLLVTVDAPVAVTFHTDRDSVCTGETILFYPTADASISGFYWQPESDLWLNAPPDSVLQHAYDHPGTIPVTLVTRFRACPERAYTDTVYVYPLPRVDLGQDTVLCLGGMPLFLHNHAAAADEARYRWNTGDTSARLRVTAPGTYSLTLSLPPLGCSNTEQVEVHKGCYIDIPNAFTPNGDGENDYFFPRQLLSHRLTKFRMQVFNRWGQLVFQTEQANGRGWDGKFNNVLQPVGVYVYLIDAEIDGREQEHYEGNVTLLR